MSSTENVHYLQSNEWAHVKSKYGWKVHVLDCPFIPAGSIKVYHRKVPGIGNICYVPCLMGITEQNATTFTDFLRKKLSKKYFAVRLELNQPKDTELLAKFEKVGWKQAQRHVQYRHTIAIDLCKAENDIWMSFKSRGRYEVTQAQKAGVSIVKTEPTDENLQKMYELMHLTSIRNKFFIRDKNFTMAYWKEFRKAGKLNLYFAFHQENTLAGTIVLTNGNLAWNKDGGSTRNKANLMAPRLMQWEIMKSLSKDGFVKYDLGGIPSPDSFKDSSMPGIYVFKSGFSKEINTLMPTLELPLNVHYKLWPKAEKQWIRVYNLFAHDLWW